MTEGEAISSEKDKIFVLSPSGKKNLSGNLPEGEETAGGLSVGSFLQVLAMDQQSCILEVANKRSGEKGLFYLQRGRILDAEVGSLSGEKAAMQMITWDEVDLHIQPATKVNRPKNIEKGLILLLLEASRIKDEQSENAETEQKGLLPEEDDVDHPNYKIIKEGIEFLKRDMGESLVSVCVINSKKTKIEEIFGDKDKKLVPFCHKARDMMGIMNMSKFKFGKYFILALEGNKIILLIPLGQYLWEITMDSEKIKLGFFFNLILPQLTSKYFISAA